MATLITNAQTVVDTAPTAATKAKAIAAAGPITDSVGMANNVLTKALELKQACTDLRAATDASDPNYTTLGTILADLV